MGVFGEFEGDVVAKWLQDDNQPDRNRQLVEGFAYIDPEGKRWEASIDRIVNGASIPPAMWNSVGPPYVGDYRRATVLHDIACEDQSETSDIVHLMFYYAMRCDGLGPFKANLMYQAVKRFGPQWGGPAGIAPMREMNATDLAKLESAVEQAVIELGIDATADEVDSRVRNILSD